MIQAGTYSATLQYLKAVKAAGTKDTEAVAKKLKELPVDDMFAQGGKVLENGRMVHDLYLFEVKKPSEVEEAMGLLQTTRRGAGRQGVSVGQGLRLPADEVIAAECHDVKRRAVFAGTARRIVSRYPGRRRSGC